MRDLQVGKHSHSLRITLLHSDLQCDLFQATNVELRDHAVVLISSRHSSADGPLHFKLFTMSDL